VDRPLYVAVVGSGGATGELYKKAREVGRLVASRGDIVVCGGLSGVMEAAARGATEEGVSPSASCPTRTEGGPTPSSRTPSLRARVRPATSRSSVRGTRSSPSAASTGRSRRSDWP
jgi:SLOG cluster4 family